MNNGGATPANSSLNANGDEQTVTFYASAAQDTAQTLTVSASGLSSGYWNTGSTLIPTSGSATLTIPAGQDSVTVGLVDTSTSQQAQTAQVSATLGSDSAVSNTVSVTFAGAAAPATTNTVITGTPYGSTGITVFQGDNANDLITGTSGPNSITAGGGNDSITGGAGNDTISTGNGNSTVAGAGGQDIITLGNGSNNLFANSVVTVSQALAQQASQSSNNSKGAFLAAGDGNNTIVGGNGNDLINVGTGADLIICGPGSTTVNGGTEVSNVTASWQAQKGTTQVDGIFTEVTFSGFTQVAAPYNAPPGYVGNYAGSAPFGNGSDTIFGGKGNDTFYLPNGNNYVDAGGGNDVIFGGAGTNTIYGGSGNDSIMGGGGSDYINAESGSDIILVEGGNSTVVAGTGNDTIYSGSYTNWATAITTNNSLISAGNGNTIVYGAGGNDTLNAGTGNDTLNAGSGNESLQGAAGSVTMIGGAGNDTLNAGTGNASITAGDGATTITGGTGVDTIYGGGGNDLISTGDGGADGSPTIVNVGSGSTTVNGGNGVDQIVGGSGTDVLNAGDGGDSGQATQVAAGSGNTTINGGLGIDNLFAGDGNDSITAGDGGTSANATSVTGGSGNDTMVAGIGYDNFYGGSADSTSNYQVNGGGGTINIYNSQANDTLTFGQNLTVGSLASVTQTAYSNGSAITLTFDDGTSVTVNGGSLTQATFGDGTVATLSQLLSDQFSFGNDLYSAVNAALPNTASPSFGHAGSVGGLNEIVAQAASPQPDKLTLYGSADLVGQGNNLNDIITANAGNDTLIAGTANNTLVGGGASDIYVVSAAAGTVTTINSSAQADTLSFTSGISLADLSVSTSADANGALDVTIQNSQGGQVVIDGTLNSTVSGGDGSSTMLDQIDFADGTTASLSQLVAQLTTGPTAATSASNVTLAGGIQNMTLTAANISATGNDQTDVLIAGAANDTLIAGSGSDTLNGARNNNTTFEFTASSGNVTIENDNSSDTLLFAPGISENQLTLTQTDVNGNTMLTITDSDGGSITFDSNITTLSFGDDSNVSISNLETTGSYTNSAATSQYANVSTTAHSGVTSLYLTGDADLAGTANSGNITIYANSGNDTLTAGTGSDTLVGGGVSEDYVIAAGNQTTTIEQSSMFDAISFGAGVTASDLSATESTVNGAEVITLTNSLGGTVNVDVGAGAPVDTILFANGGMASLGAILAQATTGASAATSAASVTLSENTQNMQLTGSASITATANALDDVITANSGNDTLVAGVGNDTLVGSSGKTTYDFDASDGNLVIQSSSAGDTLAIDDTLDESDITASSTVVGGQTVVTLTTDQGQTITINGALNQVSFADGNTASISDLLANSYTNGTSTYSNVSATAGAGITTLALTGAANITGTANSGNDTLIANGGNDTLVAGSGNDTFVGGVGNTTYSFATGYGAATIENAGTGDAIVFGPGVTPSGISIEESVASDGSITLTLLNGEVNSISIVDYTPGMADTVSFADGQTLSIQASIAQSTTGMAAAKSAVNVVLPEGIQNMTLTGTWSLVAQANDEDDVITSNSGNDTLVAGTANDTLVGGSGATTYWISAGDGKVTINDSSANDTLVFDSSMSPSDLSATSAIVNGQTVTTITNTQGGTITISGGNLSQLSFADGNITLAQLLSGSYTLGSNAYSSTSTSAGSGITGLFMTGSANVTATANGLNDTIVSNSGNDTLIAGTGKDTLIGGSGNTTYSMTAGYGAATIEAAGSGDTIAFASGVVPSDIAVTEIVGSDGAPGLQINNSQGSSITIDDYTPGTADTLSFTDGTVSIESLLAQSTTGLYAATSAVNVNLPEGILNMTLTGTANLVADANNEANVITSNGGNDTLVAGTGNDTLVGGKGTTTYEVAAGDGNVVINDSSSNDVLQFASGISASDILVSSATANGLTVTTITNSQGGTITINGGGLNAVQFAGGTSTTLTALEAAYTTFYSSYSVTLPTADTTLVLTGNAAIFGAANNGNDTLVSNSGNDTLIAGSGNDTFVGGTGNTTYAMAPDGGLPYGAATIESAGPGDIIDFPQGVVASDISFTETTVAGGSLNLQIHNSQGNTVTIDDYTPGMADTLTFVQAGSESIEYVLSQMTTGLFAATSAVNVALPGDILNMTLTGTANLVADANNEDNVITSNSGNDTLVAGTGNDTLVGGKGTTTYEINAGAGNVVINNCNANDVLQFGAGITAADLTVSAFSSLSNGYITIADGQGGTITIDNNPLLGTPYFNQIDFANGTSTTLTQLFAATAGGTQTISESGTGPIAANAVDITVTGNNIGVAGNTLDDTITLEGSGDEAEAGPGVDTLIAATGASGSTFETNTYSTTTPTTLVIDANSGTTTAIIKQGDMIDFGPGITAADVTATITAGGIGDNDWQWNLVTTQGATLLVSVEPNTDLSNMVINFANGSTATFAQLLAAPVVSGSTMTAQGNATLPAGLTDLVFTGNADVTGVNNNDDGSITTNEGNDTLTAAGANDIIYGGSGNETLVAGGNNDTFYDQSNFSSSSSTLTFGGNNDFLWFQEGDQSVTLSGANDDVDFGNTYFTTGVSFTDDNSTTIVGGGGNDTYSFLGFRFGSANQNDTSVTLENTSSSDILDLPAGLNPTQITTSSAVVNGVTVTTLSWVGGDVSVSGELQQATFSTSLYGSGYPIQTLTFGDLLSLGTPVTSSAGGTLAAGVTLYGLSASGVSATANGLNDYLAIDALGNGALNDNDTLVSGAGNDTLDGGGDSTGMEYEVVTGSGTTTILPSTSGAVLQFEGNVTASSLTATGTMINGVEVVTIQVAGANPVILDDPDLTSINFANGTSTTLSTILPTVTSSTSVTMPEGMTSLTLIGTASISATGNDDADTITANSGNDTLIAGDGGAASTLIGGSGDDTFIINHPNDVIIEAANNGDNVEDTYYSVTLAANVENLVDVGSSAMTLTANNGNDTITAGTNNDTLVGGTGNDTLIGNASAAITYLVNSGDGVITIDDSGANDVLKFGSGISASSIIASSTGSGSSTVVTLTISGGKSVVLNDPALTEVSFNGSSTTTLAALLASGTSISSSTSIVMPAGATKLTLTGTASISGTGNSLADTIIANSGNDSLIAGSGLATLVGGSGNDTFEVNNRSDVIQQATANAADIVQSSANYTLPANLSILTGTGSTAITLTGNNLADKITANSGNDTLVAGSGLATLTGGSGNDTFVVNSTSDVVSESTAKAGNVVQSNVSYTLGANLENLAGSGSTAINLTGNTLADTITANSGNDTLTSGTGVDTLVAGSGNDTFVIGNSSDAITATSAKAGNIVQSSVSYVLPTNLETLTGTGSTAISLTGNGSADTITANSGNDTLTAGSGLATLIGGSGNDTFVVNNASDAITETTAKAGNIVQSSVSYVLPTNLETLTGTGTGAISLTGNASTDTITANSGNDTLTAGTGLATLVGGSGNDTFVVNNASDVITESTAKAGNVVQSNVSYTLPTDLMTLTGTGTGSIGLTGNASPDTITANSGNDTLTAGSGLATLIGGTGNDTFVVNSASDVITEAANTGNNTEQSSVSVTLAANVQNLTGTSTGSITLTGNSLNNVITANSGNDTLVAGAGNDTLVSGVGNDSMTGGAGNDTFVVSNSNDKITVSTAKAGNVVQSSVTYVLPANLLNLTGTGSSAISLTGNASADTITANSGNDTLTAGTGVATLVGGSGNDTFVVDNASDVITVSAARAGNVTQSAVSYVLPANLLSLTGTGSTAISLTGNTLADTLTANSGNDTLVSGTGIDTLVGGSGNDTFVVNNSGDAITVSTAKAGNVVQSTVNYVLPTNLLSLTGTGTSAISLTGNASADTITANSGNDTLTAGSGLATLIGGAGNDTFVVNSASDVITEAANTGNNTESTDVTITLATNVENLTGTGSTAIKLTGNSGNDVITGNSGNDTLVAGSGNDTLIAGTGSTTTTFTGSTGNDTFVVNSATDVITASSGTNVNTVQSSVSYTAPTNVQDLFGTGGGAITLTGNSGNDLLIGGTGNDTLTAGSGAAVLEAGSGTDVLKDSASANVLLAGAGNDSMTGGTGASFIAGGAGNDAITLGAGATVVAFNTGAGKATIAAGSDTSNVLSLGGGIAYANLAFSKSGNNLILSTGGNNTITFTNWYSAAADQDFVTLQVIEQAAATYSSTSTNTLYSSDVETFNFTSLVAAFNTALAANPSLTSWSLSNSLLTDHLSSSNTAAMGGDLAYYDGLNGNLTGMNLATADTTVASSSFGKTAQTIDAWSGISTGNNKLH